MSQANSGNRRAYRSRVRADQAAATRDRVARSAADLFVEQGYAATTVAGIATRAGVSAQTVYNAFGTKAALLKAAYDAALVGDGEPVPLAERPEVVALYAEPDPVRFVRGYAALGRRVLDQVGPLMLLISSGAAAGEADLVELQRTTNAERLVGTGMVADRVADLGALAPGVTTEGARDRLWTLNSVEVWHLLTGTLGWSGDAYEEWIGEAMCAAVLAAPAR
jgi:AcrR family transcriptional regulator